MLSLCLDLTVASLVRVLHVAVQKEEDLSAPSGLQEDDQESRDGTGNSGTSAHLCHSDYKLARNASAAWRYSGDMLSSHLHQAPASRRHT